MKATIMKKNWIYACVLTATLGTGLAQAQGQAPASQPSQAVQPSTPAKKALAEKIVAFQQGPERQLLLQQLSGVALRPVVEKWSQRVESDVPAAKQDGVRKQLDAQLNTLHDQVLKTLQSESVKTDADTLVPLYQQQFTEQELNELVALFGSPAFKKYQGVAPTLSNAYVQKLVERTRSVVQDQQGAFDSKAAGIVNAAK